MADQPPNPNQPIMLTAENLLAILNGVTSIPMQHLQVMQQVNQQNLNQIVAAFREQTQVNHALLAQMAAPPPPLDPLRKLRESDPQFPTFLEIPWIFQVAS